MMKNRLILDYVLGQHWLLDHAVMRSMVNVMSYRLGDSDASIFNKISTNSPTYNALITQNGKSYGQCAEIRDNGVVVVHVNGVISRYASLFHKMCGGTSTQWIAQSIQQAIDDPNVSAIVLNIDSPGGQATGIHELSEIIYSARQSKRIIAYVGGLGASAAYWIASAAHEVVLDKTASVGSIGVVSTLHTNADDESTIEFVSTQSPKKRLDPNTTTGQEDFQSHVDYLADVFIECVARNRGCDIQCVMQDFGQGGLLVGDQAVKQGAADRLGSLEAVIQKLSTGKKNMTTKTTFTLPSEQEMAAPVLLEQLIETRSDLASAFSQRESGKEEMALQYAASLSNACVKEGFPELVPALMKPDLTKSQAEAQIQTAKQLKSVLAASGLSNSFSALVPVMSEPAKLVGKVIHEVQAQHDQSQQIKQQLAVSDHQKKELCVRDIMSKRQEAREQWQ